MTLCEHALQLILLSAGTYFWLWYLTWEGNHYKRKDDDGSRWWERGR